MQNCFGLLDADVMPMFMIIALDIFIIMWFSINFSAVICSPAVIFAILREAPSETYGPWVSFPLYWISFPYYLILFTSYLFPIYKPKIPKIFTLLFIYLYQISLLQVTVKGLTTPLSRWVQVVDCSCRYSVTCALSTTGLIPWFSKWGNYLRYFAASPFPLQGKNQRKLKK